MRNTSSSTVRRALLIAVVGVLTLLLAVSSVSAAPSAFNPLSPGSATAPGPEITAVPDPLVITWEESTDTVAEAVISYTWTVEINGGAPIAVPVPTDQSAVAGGVVTWTVADEELAAIAGVLVNGTYEWYVVATSDNATPDNTGDDTTTTSSSFYFTVNIVEPAAPGAFRLDGPPGATVGAGAYLRTLPTAVPVTWTPAADAEGYTFTLFQISGNVRIGEIVEVDATPAELGCDTVEAELCTLPADFAALDLATGQYAWTVVASNELGDTEASNAPYYFQINVDPIELVRNGSFENPAAKPNAAIPANWKLVNGNGDRRQCTNVPAGGDGVCAFKGTGGVLATLSQLVPTKLVNQIALSEGDSLTINALVRSAQAVPAASKLQVVLTAGTGRNQEVQRINVPFDNEPGDSFDAITTVTADVTLEDTVNKIAIRIQSKSGFFIDAVSVVVNPVTPSALR
jgi:hypothetical protein